MHGFGSSTKSRRMKNCTPEIDGAHCLFKALPYISSSVKEGRCAFEALNGLSCSVISPCTVFQSVVRRESGSTISFVIKIQNLALWYNMVDELVNAERKVSVAYFKLTDGYKYV